MVAPGRAASAAWTAAAALPGTGLVPGTGAAGPGARAAFFVRAISVEQTGGDGIDGDGDGIADVYDPGDAIPSAAYFLQAYGAPADLQAALLAFNHSAAYVSDVLSWAARYAAGGTEAIAAASSPLCQQAAIGPLPAGTAGKVIAYAEAQLGKAYQYGAAGPDAFDCSGLAMMAYRAAGLYVPRTSQEQWQFGTWIPPSAAQPGDLVFFAGSDGTPQAPGHVGIVIGNGKMIEAYATGYPIRISTYGMPSLPPGDQVVAGVSHPRRFSKTRPWLGKISGDCPFRHAGESAPVRAGVRRCRTPSRSVNGQPGAGVRDPLCAAVWLMGNAARAAPNRGSVPGLRGWASSQPSAVVPGCGWTSGGDDVRVSGLRDFSSWLSNPGGCVR